MTPLHILVVDDDVDFAQSLQMLLTLEGHKVTLAHSGQEAVNVFDIESFDLAFMDVRLPGKNGVESFLAIRKKHPHARVVMMTAYSGELLLSRAVEAQALAIVHKPFEKKQILELIDKAGNDSLILIADEDPGLTDRLCKDLHQHGFQTFVAANAAEALSFQAKDFNNVLILDLKRPLLCSIEVLLSLKRGKHHRHTLIMNTTLPAGVKPHHYFNHFSAMGFLVKPFNIDDLTKTISIMTHRREKHR